MNERTELFSQLSSIPKIYQEMITAFNKTKTPKVPINKNDLLNNLLWGNRYLIYKDPVIRKNTTLYFKNWIDKGITKIKDILIINSKIDINYIFDKLDRKGNIFSETHKINMVIKPFIYLLDHNIPDALIYVLPKHPEFIMDQTSIDIT